MSQTLEQQIKTIQKATKEITSSREKEHQYLKRSGISDFIQKASKSVQKNGSGSSK